MTIYLKAILNIMNVAFPTISLKINKTDFNFDIQNNLGIELSSLTAKIISNLKNDLSFKLEKLENNVYADNTVIDNLDFKYRFSVIYILLQQKINLRKTLNFGLKPKFSLIHQTISNVFYGIGAVEREIYDLFGIFFKDHPDLRRVVTDYGFKGNPLKKDFPLTGTIEIFYSVIKKILVFKPLKLSQEMRTFDYESPWISNDDFFNYPKTEKEEDIEMDSPEILKSLVFGGFFGFDFNPETKKDFKGFYDSPKVIKPYNSPKIIKPLEIIEEVKTVENIEPTKILDWVEKNRLTSQNNHLIHKMEEKNIQIGRLIRNNQEKGIQINLLVEIDEQKEIIIGQFSQLEQQRDIEIDELSQSDQQKSIRINELLQSDEKHKIDIHLLEEIVKEGIAQENDLKGKILYQNTIEILHFREAIAKDIGQKEKVDYCDNFLDLYSSYKNYKRGNAHQEIDPEYRKEISKLTKRYVEMRDSQKISSEPLGRRSIDESLLTGFLQYYFKHIPGLKKKGIEGNVEKESLEKKKAMNHFIRFLDEVFINDEQKKENSKISKKIVKMTQKEKDEQNTITNIKKFAIDFTCYMERKESAIEVHSKTRASEKIIYDDNLITAESKNMYDHYMKLNKEKNDQENNAIVVNNDTGGGNNNNNSSSSSSSSSSSNNNNAIRKFINYDSNFLPQFILDITTNPFYLENSVICNSFFGLLMRIFLVIMITLYKNRHLFKIYYKYLKFHNAVINNIVFICCCKIVKRIFNPLLDKIKYFIFKFHKFLHKLLFGEKMKIIT